MLMIFYSYTPSPYMNTTNSFDRQFKIFTQLDTTKSYVILNESMNKLLSVSESIVLMRYAFYETSFNDPTVKSGYLYMLRDRIRQKSQRKTISEIK